MQFMCLLQREYRDCWGPCKLWVSDEKTFIVTQGTSRQTMDWSGSRSAGSPAAPALSAREASCLCDALVRLYHLGMVSAFRHVLYQQQSGTQALQHYDELQQRLPVSTYCSVLSLH